MILYTQAFSKDDAAKFVTGKHPLSAPLTRAFENRVAWIGIDEYGDSPIMRNIASLRAPHLVLEFVDVNPDIYASFGTTFYKAMSREQAETVVRFVSKLHKSPDTWAVLVHCQMGISRSAAVSEWIQEQKSIMPREEWSKIHLHCLPNPYVRRLLVEASGKNK